MTQLRVHVDGYADSDDEERADLASRLREEMVEQGVEDVAHPEAPAPEGAKGGALEWAQLVVGLAGTVRAMLTALRAWFGRHPAPLSRSRSTATSSRSTALRRPSSSSCSRPSWPAMTPDDGPAGRRRALLVATANYSDAGLAALRAPTSDVRSLGEVLSDDAIGGFEVRELIDRPTEELKQEIEGFFGDGRPKDLLMLYVSGHGVLSQNRRFYLATTSTALQLLRSTAIEDSFVNDVMQQSRARSIVLVLDCCHSGAFGKGLCRRARCRSTSSIASRGAAG